MESRAWLGMVVLACIGLARPAMAAGGACGTIVVPTGIGVSSSADVTSFNPLLVNSLYNQQAAELMYLNLFWLNGNTEQIDWSRSLASSVTSPDNGTTYIVTLKDRHWSDGVPITTADVAYTWKLINELGTSYVGYGAGGMPMIVKQFKVLSPTKFEVVLKHKVNQTWYIYNGLNALLPLPVHAWGKYTQDEIWQAQSSPKFFQVVDGPMRPARLDVGLDLVMVPNPNFEGGKVHMSRLIYKFLESDGAGLQGVESGDLDMANVPDAAWRAAQHVPGLKLVNLPPSSTFNEIELNLRDPDVAFLRDWRVRQAMADAINQPEMVRLIFHGQGEAVYGPVPPSPPTFLTPAMKAGVYPVGYNPAKARALLAAAGYSPGPDGIMRKDGKPLSFVFLMLSGDAVIEQMTEFIQQDLMKIGVQMKVREIEFNQMLALLNNPSPSSWQAAGLAETLTSYPTGEDLFATNAFGNSGGYSDPAMDQFIADSTNKPGLQGLYDYETYASAQQPVLFFATAGVSMLVNPRIHGASHMLDAFYNFYPDKLSCTAK
ncbi:MAG: peptide ABC transporter substrate-binding protein [Acidocella sp.]|nr:peptide ABC transporter substrate-binding protein [Acidocella sp.]